MNHKKTASVSLRIRKMEKVLEADLAGCVLNLPAEFYGAPYAKHLRKDPTKQGDWEVKLTYFSPKQKKLGARWHFTDPDGQEVFVGLGQLALYVQDGRLSSS